MPRHFIEAQTQQWKVLEHWEFLIESQPSRLRGGKFRADLFVELEVELLVA